MSLCETGLFSSVKRRVFLNLPALLFATKGCSLISDLKLKLFSYHQHFKTDILVSLIPNDFKLAQLPSCIIYLMKKQSAQYVVHMEEFPHLWCRTDTNVGREKCSNVLSKTIALLFLKWNYFILCVWVFYLCLCLHSVSMHGAGRRKLELQVVASYLVVGNAVSALCCWAISIPLSCLSFNLVRWLTLTINHEKLTEPISTQTASLLYRFPIFQCHCLLHKRTTHHEDKNKTRPNGM